MPLVRVTHLLREAQRSDWDLDADSNGAAPAIRDLAAELVGLRARARRLEAFSTDALVAYFDALAAHWSEPHSPVASAFGRFGLAFLLGFMRRERLARMLDRSLRGTGSTSTAGAQAPTATRTSPPFRGA